MNISFCFIFSLKAQMVSIEVIQWIYGTVHHSHRWHDVAHQTVSVLSPLWDMVQEGPPYCSPGCGNLIPGLQGMTGCSGVVVDLLLWSLWSGVAQASSVWGRDCQVLGSSRKVGTLFLAHGRRANLWWGRLPIASSSLKLSPFSHEFFIWASLFPLLTLVFWSFSVSLWLLGPVMLLCLLTLIIK